MRGCERGARSRGCHRTSSSTCSPTSSTSTSASTSCRPTVTHVHREQSLDGALGAHARWGRHAGALAARRAVAVLAADDDDPTSCRSPFRSRIARRLAPSRALRHDPELLFHREVRSERLAIARVDDLDVAEDSGASTNRPTEPVGDLPPVHVEAAVDLALAHGADGIDDVADLVSRHRGQNGRRRRRLRRLRASAAAAAVRVTRRLA